MLFPQFEEEETINIFPLEEKSIVKNIHSPIITISTDIEIEIKINITLFELDDETIHIVYIGKMFESQSFEDLESGFYKFDFYSSNIGTVTITGKGINPIVIGIISLLFLIRVIIFINNRYFSSLDELIT